MFRYLCAGALLCAATAAQANEFKPAMQSYLDSQIAAWSTDPIVLTAIAAANTASAGYDQATIDTLDLTWRAEVGTANMPTISPIIDSPASAHLRDIVAASGGAITEIIAMDNRGLNAAVSDVTSDMWQGDEEKFSQTYPMGPGATHFSDVELDESTQTYQAQISFTVTDPASGMALGAMTVGVNVDVLAE